MHSGHLEELKSVLIEVFEQLHEIELVVMYVNPLYTLDGSLIANTLMQQMLRG
jgi:hypothetical protein